MDTVSKPATGFEVSPEGPNTQLFKKITCLYVMESDQMCVCVYGVTLKNSVISSCMLVLGLDSVWKKYPGL